MLKKLLTGCLTIAAAAALAVPAMAADTDVTVGGRAHSSLQMYTYSPEAGDGYSQMDIESEGRIDVKAMASEGDWSFSGRVEVRSSYGSEAYSSPVILQKYFSLENDAFALSMGTKWFGLAYMTPFMGLSDAIDRECYGCSDLRNDRISFKLKEVGLEIVYGSEAEAVDATGDDYQATQFGAMYVGAFGPVKLGVQYLSTTNAMIENKNSTTDTTSTKEGTSATELVLMAQYAISEAMFVEFDYESTSNVNADGADPVVSTVMGLAFSMALSEAQGFTFSYDMHASDSGTSDSADDTSQNEMILYFTQNMGGGTLFAGYESNAYATDSEATYATTALAVGGRINF